MSSGFFSVSLMSPFYVHISRKHCVHSLQLKTSNAIDLRPRQIESTNLFIYANWRIDLL